MRHGHEREGGTTTGTRCMLVVDEGSGLIRKAVLTPANVNDTEVADELINGGRGGGVR